VQATNHSLHITSHSLRRPGIESPAPGGAGLESQIANYSGPLMTVLGRFLMMLTAVLASLLQMSLQRLTFASA